jgi:hypothetical protein
MPLLVVLAAAFAEIFRPWRRLLARRRTVAP